MTDQPNAATDSPAARSADTAPPAPSVRGLLARGAAATFAMKVASVGLTFIAGVLGARLLGPTGYGAYNYAFAWMGLCLLLATVGTDRLVTREVAACQARRDHTTLAGILRWSRRAVLSIAVPIALIASLVAWLLTGRELTVPLLAFWVAAPMIVATALSLLFEGQLRGFRRVATGQIAEMLIRPALLTAALAALWLTTRDPLHPAAVMGLCSCAAVVAMALNAMLAHRHTPPEVRRAQPSTQTRLWWRCAIPLMLVGGLRLLNNRAAVIMLGAMRGMFDAGIYAAASRVAMLVTFVLLSINAALAPLIAGLYAQGEHRRLQRVVTRAARITLALTVPLAAALCLLRYPVLRLFGEDFTRGHVALMILIAGQVVNAAAGSVAVLLMMTGHERTAATGTGLGVAVNLMLNAVLIPRYGIVGAAIATAASTAAMNLLLAVAVRRALAIDSTAMGLAPAKAAHHG